MGKTNNYTDIKDAEKVETVFSEATTFNGVLKFDRSIKIEGKFKGRIISKGFLIIGETAKVRANIKASSIIIAGELRGDVEAYERLEMLPTGKLYGNIKTKKLKMADGVVFEGSCEMLKYTGAQDLAVGSQRTAGKKKEVYQTLDG